ncbi:MAG: hypothetical protein WDZ69_00925 [Candidatus Pacearchaeota archaeon]
MDAGRPYHLSRKILERPNLLLEGLCNANNLDYEKYLNLFLEEYSDMINRHGYSTDTRDDLIRGALYGTLSDLSREKESIDRKLRESGIFGNTDDGESSFG